MDRPVAKTTIRQRQMRRIAMIMLIGIALLAAWWGFRRQLQTTIAQERIRVAVAELGPVESTIRASGEVIPAFEQVLASPIPATIQEVLLPVGSAVQADDRILQLDKSLTIIEYERLKDQLELTYNGIAKLRLTLEQSLYDLQINDSIKALNIARLEAERINARRLLEIGGGVQEQVDEAELNLKIARLEKRQLENNLSVQQRATITDLKEEEIKARIQGHALAELEQKLQRADIRANRSGVLTWVNDRIGATISEGETLARIADLAAYKVVGTVSDLYAEQVRTGMSAIVDVNGIRLPGRVTGVRPVVENNIVTFDIQLIENNHPTLRPNMKVEVFIITDAKERAVRVANGPAFTGQPAQPLFILQNGIAERREVEIGLSNFDFVEIIRHVAPGETVIISDMSSYRHLPKVRVK